VPDSVMNELGSALGVKGDHVDVDVEMSDSSSSKSKVVGGFGQVRKAVEKVVREGYSAVQILSQVRVLSLFLSIARNDRKVLMYFSE